MKISVALATFNGSKYLLEQLESLARQDLLPYEVVVVDDGSTDGTLDVVKNFAPNAPFSVHIEKNENRLGYGLNFLKAANLCAGDAIAFCDQDDVWLPEKLGRVVEAMVVHRVDFVAHSANVVDKDLSLTDRRYPDIEQDTLLTPEIFRHNFYPGFAITITKSFFGAVKKLMANPGFSVEAHDELICEIAACGRRRYEISKSLVNYRQHQSNLIGYHGAIQKQKVA